MRVRLSKRTLHWALLAILFAGTITTVLVLAKDPKSITATETDPNVTLPPLEPPAPAEPETAKPLSDRIVEYHIAVRLDADEKQLNGVQTMVWKNPGTKPVSELYFHLYPNAFRSKQTTFFRESGGKLRSDTMKPGSFGWMDVASIRTAEGEDLTPTIRYVQPDDGNEHDRTLISVRLPKPVDPGGRVQVDMAFRVKLPHVFARMGYAGDFVMAGQWFPKIAVYEPKGTRGRAEEGWNLHQYHGNSEFYADFGLYNVTIEVPSGYTVAATGFLTEPPAVDGPNKTYHFYAEDVHDFAWAASPHFIYVEEPFSAPNVPGVKIKLYLDPAHRVWKDRYLYAAKRSLAKYAEWFGAYPYSTLSIVVPPADANGAGGMEYPTLVTAWGASKKTPGLELERVVVHEIGHQFWYGIVASNEFEEAWLDEGFTSYAEDLAMADIFGQTPNLPIEASYMTSPAPLSRFSWQYDGHGHYADNVYTRAKLVLAGIERQIGREQMLRVLGTYFERWKFKHPTTKDFQTVLEEVTGTSWSDYFDQFVYGGKMTDYAVERLHIRRVEQDGRPAYENTVIVRKYDGHYTTVPIVFRFADGTSVEKSWDGKDARTQFKLISRSPLEWVAIDPERTIVLENRRINNFMRTSVDGKWNVRLNIGIAKLIETIIGSVAW